MALIWGNYQPCDHCGTSFYFVAAISTTNCWVIIYLTNFNTSSELSGFASAGAFYRPVDSRPSRFTHVGVLEKSQCGFKSPFSGLGVCLGAELIKWFGWSARKLESTILSCFGNLICELYTWCPCWQIMWLVGNYLKVKQKWLDIIFVRFWSLHPFFSHKFIIIFFKI